MFEKMKHNLAVIITGLCIAVLSFGGSIATAQETEGGNVMWHSDSDQKMIDAIDKARETLPYFWTMKNSGDSTLSSFSIKAGLDTASGNIEHIWVDDLTKKGATISGVLANDPLDLGDLAYGDLVSFTIEQVSDWSYEKDGKMYGQYTTRVLLSNMSPAEAAPYFAVLGDNP